MFKSKKKYLQPEVKIIHIDNEISLALESAPPVGPEEGYNNLPDVYNNQKPVLS
jgi:hypothetical protein